LGFKILVRGADAPLGKLVLQLLDDQPLTVLKTPSEGPKFEEELAALVVLEQPHIFLNLEQVLDLEAAKLPEPAIVSLVNVCAAGQIPIVHTSSYEVFGDAWLDEGLDENFSEHKPSSARAKMLLANEREIEKVDHQIILRCSWMINGGVEPVLSRIVPLLLSDDAFVVSDHHSAGPISIEFLARAVVAIAQQVLTGADNWGVFHLHSADSCSEAEFCDHLIRALKKELDREFKFPELAGQNDERALFQGCALLKGRRCTDDFGIQLPTWRRGFAAHLRAWLHSQGIKAEEKSD
jgi:dTDP-4-dehydrorhamnose reductase